MKKTSLRALAKQSSVVIAVVLCSCNKTEIHRDTPTVLTVYEYTPAPGQFINDTGSGFTGAETTPAAAAAYAQARLGAGNWVSLGGWGGYIVVGLGQPVEKSFSVKGNMHTGSSEPGIVWVMQDTDGNGGPDDVWYELKGSEYGAAGTIREYEVTYYRPDTDRMPVRWTDNLGGEGTIDYIPDYGIDYHTQPTYWPAWITGGSYTLRGTRLADNVTLDGAVWVMAPYAWGYADNFGEDAAAGWNSFSIANAVRSDGSPAGLSHVDFIKVQTGVNAKAGRTGEISTEVAGFSR